MEKLIAEADAVLGRDYSYRPTYEDCAKLDYTQRVLKEALRLTPTAPMIMRQVMRDTTIGGGRYELKAGHKIGISLQVVQRDPRYWDNPTAFDPDRFLPEAEEARHPDAYHPFGMGMRACIGFQYRPPRGEDGARPLRPALRREAARSALRVARKADPDDQADHLDMVVERRPETKVRFPAKAAPAPAAAPANRRRGSRRFGPADARALRLQHGKLPRYRGRADPAAGQRGYAPVLRAPRRAGRPALPHRRAGRHRHLDL